MRPLWLRRLVWSAGAFLGISGIAVAGLHAHTERLMRIDPGPEFSTLPAGDAVEGARLGQVLGCTACHGQDLAGRVFVEVPLTARIVAPNLTIARDRYDDAGLLRLMRTGRKSDGRLALVMPNKAFQRLTDQQVADIIAFLRSAPTVATEPPRAWLSPVGRLAVVMGVYDLEEMKSDPPESAGVLADRNHPDRGRQLAQVVCGECHGMDFRGFPAQGTPPLDVVRAYTPEHLMRLMREGRTPSGGETASGFMSGVARYRFTALTDDEIMAIKSYFDGAPAS